MNILTFTHLFPNTMQPVWGVFVYQRILHFSIRPGNEVRVVAPVPYIPRWFPGRAWEKYKHIPRHETVTGLSVDHPRYLHVPKIAMPLHGLLLFLGCYRHVAKLHREHRFDCIDSHWVYPDGFAAAAMGKALRLPVFCSARGTDINVYPTFVVIRALIRWSLRQVNGVIAVSEALKQIIVNLGIPEKKIRVIGNGVDVRRFAPIERRQARKRLGLPLDGQLVVAVGSLNEHKSHALLISSVKLLSTRWPQLRVYILGEGPLRESLETLIMENGLHGRMQLSGCRPNEELSLWYSAADVSCLSSSREGWPNVVMESLACGTPVVATRVGGVPEIIVSPEYGILADTNVAAFAEALESGLHKRWDRDAIVCYARLRSWEQVAAEMESFFAERMAPRAAKS